MTDSILIVGGGIAGLTAAQECVNAGARAIVVDKAAIIGGKLAAAMTADSSAGDSLDGVPVPKLDQLAAMENIEFITLASLDSIDGRPGNFEVAIRERARFVTDACTNCRHCRPVCPSVSANEYDAGLTYRKAIFEPLPGAQPAEYVIDIESCLNSPPNYLPCNRCIEVCDDDAIHFDMALDRLHTKHVGAVVLATGFDMSADGRLKEFGYGKHDDIVTSAELQRLLLEPGPTGGYAAKPSTEDYPDSVLYLIEEMSPFIASMAVSQLRQLAEQDVERIEVLITEQTDSALHSEFLQSLPPAVSVHRGLLQAVEAGPENRVSVSYAEFDSNRLPQAEVDMVVLGTEPRPAPDLRELAGVFGLELADDGWVSRASPEVPCKTSSEGIYVAGGVHGPVALNDTVEEARVAAIGALSHLDPRLLKPEYRPIEPVESVEEAPDEELRARIERALSALMN